MYLAQLLEKLEPAFSALGFASAGGGVFRASEQTLRVGYDEQTKLFELFRTVGEEPETKLSAFLFDETQTADDLDAVAIDFVDAVQKALGKKQTRRTADVELPKASGGEKATVTDLVQKLLAIFPQYKEDYKAHMAQYGRLLTVDFCHTRFIPAIQGLLSGGNKKAARKFLDAMTTLYIAADAATVPYVVGLLAVGANGNADALAAVKEACAECPALYTAVVNFYAAYKHNKKLQAAF